MIILPDKIKEEIRRGLPGAEVQWQMASSDRMASDFPKVPRNDSRVAAVLILLYPFNGSVYTVFIQRPEYNGIHSGQISFPGGKMEAGDKNITETALREAFEETGADISKISVIDTLTPLFIPVSNTVVTPVVGWTDARPDFRHQPEEVEYLIEADMDVLLRSSAIKTKPFNIRGVQTLIKYFDYDGNVIWGATAMILHEFLTVIRRIDKGVRE